MWFTAGAQAPFPYTIGYAWSNDGISWNVHSSNPVLTPTQSWEIYTVLAPYVLRENGQYKMWYSGCATSALLHRIGHATSPDGINWTKHPSNPVFEPGTASWESGAVTYPCIMPYSNGYKIWYGGYSPNVSEQNFS
jgi:beta-1,2-mannobiose phosphorylase / 1,2-beta-oligomannan phosphorylase